MSPEMFSMSRNLSIPSRADYDPVPIIPILFIENSTPEKS
jgi:hypothetical protein